MTSTAVHCVIGVAIGEPETREDYSWQHFEFMLQDGSVHTVTAFFDSNLGCMAAPQKWKIDEDKLLRRLDDKPRQKKLFPPFQD